MFRVKVIVLILLLRNTGRSLVIDCPMTDVEIREQACSVHDSSVSLRNLASGSGLDCNDQYYDVADWLRRQLSLELPECETAGVVHLHGPSCAAHAMRDLKLFAHYVNNLQDLIPSEWANTYSQFLQDLEGCLVDLVQGLCYFCVQLTQEEGQPASTCTCNDCLARERSWQGISTMATIPACSCSPEQGSAFLNQTRQLGPNGYSEDDFTKAIVSVTCSLTQFLNKLHLVDGC